jgi:hypothetical protein
LAPAHQYADQQPRGHADADGLPRLFLDITVDDLDPVARPIGYSAMDLSSGLSCRGDARIEFALGVGQILTG